MELQSLMMFKLNSKYITKWNSTADSPIKAKRKNANRSSSRYHNTSPHMLEHMKIE